MTDTLNRVVQVVTTTGNIGSSIVLDTTAAGDSFFTMAEAGAVDGQPYDYVITDGNDVEIQVDQTWTAASRTFTRGTPALSKVGGASGTSKVDLSGTARLRIFESAELINKALRSDLNLSDLADAAMALTNLGGTTVGKALFTAADAAAARAATGAIGSVVKQVFTASGTYTPTTGMVHAIIECVGGGGAGGGSAGLASQYYAGGGGGAGGYSRKYVTASDIGASKTVTIGAGGSGTGNAAGSAGADTSVGVLCIGKGGLGGIHSNTSSAPTGGAGGVAGTGDVAAAGMSGNTGVYATTAATLLASGYGGNSFYGGGASGKLAGNGTSVNGNTAGAYGSGGSGASSNNVAGTTPLGGDGSAGLVVITEYVVN